MGTTQNITMQHYNGTDYDTLYPQTKDSNIFDANGLVLSTKLSHLVLNVLDFNAKGDKTTDDTAAIQSAINTVQTAGGGTVIIPQGLSFKISSINISKPNVRLTGGGTLYNGYLLIGDPTTIQDLNYVVDNLTFEYDAIATGSNAIEMINARKGRITGNLFRNFDKAVYVRPSSDTQHCSRAMISNNVFHAGNYCLYVSAPSSSSTTFAVGDFHFQNNQADEGIQHTHIYGVGVDGLVMTGNTLFFPSYQEQNANKEHHVYISLGNFIVINANNLFEAGLESILLDKVQNVNVSNNNIPWAGQRVASSAIKFTGGDMNGSKYNLSTVNGNNISFPTKNGIEAIDTCGYIDIFGNMIRACGDATYYYGGGSLSSSFAISTGSSTERIMSIGNHCSSNLNNFNSTDRFYALNQDINKETLKYSPLLTVSDNSTTIDVTGIDSISLNQPNATSIDTINGGQSGKDIRFRSFNGNTTLVNGTSIALKGAVNAVIPNNGILGLTYSSGKWVETYRNF